TKDVMPIKQSLHKGLVPVHIYTNDIDHSAIQQLLNISNLPIVHPHVAAMPDVHMGIGATVGSVIPTERAIIPAAVGVDIGCGMNAVRTSLTASDLPDSLAELRHDIERSVPLGTGGAHGDEHWAGDLFDRMPKTLEKVSTKNAGRQLG